MIDRKMIRVETFFAGLVAWFIIYNFTVMNGIQSFVIAFLIDGLLQILLVLPVTRVIFGVIFTIIWGFVGLGIAHWIFPGNTIAYWIGFLLLLISSGLTHWFVCR